MKKVRKDVSQKPPVLLKVSRSSPKRSHIEIPAEHREDFKPGDHVWVEKVEIPSSTSVARTAKTVHLNIGKMLQGVPRSLGAEEPMALPVKCFRPAYVQDYDKNSEELFPSRKPKRSKQEVQK